MPIIVEPKKDNEIKPTKKVILLMKKTIYVDSPEFTSLTKEIQDLYAKGIFDEILLLRDDEETMFKIFENEYVIATLKDMDYLKQKINALVKAFSDHKMVVDKTLDYLKGEAFNLKGKIYYLEEEISKHKVVLDELRNVTKAILDIIKKAFEQKQLKELKAKVIKE